MIAGIVLAAGSSARMGSPKALLDAAGATFLARLAGTMRSGGCAEVVAVVPSDGGAVAVEARGAGCLAAVNPGGRGGQIASLRAGLGAVRNIEPPAAAILFSPVDNPAVRPDTIRALIAAWRETGTPIVMPRHGDERGHPVLIEMATAAEFDAPDLAEGARSVVRRDPARVLEVAVADRGTIDDLDTPERYRARFGKTTMGTGVDLAGDAESSNCTGTVPGMGSARDAGSFGGVGSVRAEKARAGGGGRAG